MSELSIVTPFGEISRRRFLSVAGTGLLAAGVAGTLAQQAAAQEALSGAQKPIPLPQLVAKTEQDVGPPPLPMPPSQKLGVAVVGLGTLALHQIIPALGQSKNVRLTALVSGQRDKALEVAQEHGIPESSIYSYDTYDQIKNNPAVDFVYIVLPNALHAEYTIRGAQAGKHVLCEKPMATSSKDCRAMIEACDRAGRKLMIAYRIQYEPNNRTIRQFVRSAQYGKVKHIAMSNGQNQGDPSQWRQKKALSGGGSLPDVGLYCLNTTRFLLGEEPEEIVGWTYSTPGDPRFTEVEETCVWQMRFPSGVLAGCDSGYGFHESRRYRVHAESGWYGMDPAFSYEGLEMQLSYAQGDTEYRQTPRKPVKNQFALEMDHFAECIVQNKKPFTPGEEGLQDQRIMEAIYESASSNKPVKLEKITTKDTFRGSEPSA